MQKFTNRKLQLFKKSIQNQFDTTNTKIAKDGTVSETWSYLDLGDVLLNVYIGTYIIFSSLCIYNRIRMTSCAQLKIICFVIMS